MSAVYERQLGPVESLRPGQWTDRTASGRPALSCVKCGGIYDVPETHGIDERGYVMPALTCEYLPCGTCDLVLLANYRDEVAR